MSRGCGESVLLNTQQQGTWWHCGWAWPLPFHNRGGDAELGVGLPGVQPDGRHLNPGQMLTRDSVSSSVEWCYAPAARCDCDRPVWAQHPQAAASPSPSPVLTVTQVCLLCPHLQSSFCSTPGSVLDVRFPLCSFVQRAPCWPASRACPPLVPLLCPRQSSDLVSGLVSPPRPRLTPRPLTHAAYSCITCPAKFWETG